jgi:hypothetical protein
MRPIPPQPMPALHCPGGLTTDDVTARWPLGRIAGLFRDVALSVTVEDERGKFDQFAE